ncbi:cyclase family protein [Candidatus Micrarchaeota archaeon]|nr:cyclase family protein [Candidatus Micrarchaeota archaeon]
MVFPYSKMIDVSMSISEDMPVYQGDPVPKFEWAKKLPENSSFVTRISFGAHTGTHVDAPMHFKLGALGLDDLPLSTFVGEALVVDASKDAPAVTLETVQRAGVKKGDVVLFRTRNSLESKWREDFVSVSPDAAAWLSKQGIKAVGVDGLSVDKYKSGNHPTHHALLDEGVAIIEGLRLKEAKPGRYFLVCLPLKLKGREAAPARAVLFQ